MESRGEILFTTRDGGVVRSFDIALTIRRDPQGLIDDVSAAAERAGAHGTPDVAVAATVADFPEQALPTWRPKGLCGATGTVFAALQARDAVVAHHLQCATDSFFAEQADHGESPETPAEGVEASKEPVASASASSSLVSLLGACSGNHASTVVEHLGALAAVFASVCAAQFEAIAAAYTLLVQESTPNESAVWTLVRQGNAAVAGELREAVALATSLLASLPSASDSIEGGGPPASQRGSSSIKTVSQPVPSDVASSGGIGSLGRRVVSVVGGAVRDSALLTSRRLGIGGVGFEGRGATVRPEWRRGGAVPPLKVSAQQSRCGPMVLVGICGATPYERSVRSAEVIASDGATTVHPPPPPPVSSSNTSAAACVPPLGGFYSLFSNASWKSSPLESTKPSSSFVSHMHSFVAAALGYPKQRTPLSPLVLFHSDDPVESAEIAEIAMLRRVPRDEGQFRKAAVICGSLRAFFDNPVEPFSAAPSTLGPVPFFVATLVTPDLFFPSALDQIIAQKKNTKNLRIFVTRHSNVRGIAVALHVVVPRDMNSGLTSMSAGDTESPTDAPKYAYPAGFRESTMKLDGATMSPSVHPIPILGPALRQFAADVRAVFQLCFFWEFPRIFCDLTAALPTRELVETSPDDLIHVNIVLSAFASTCQAVAEVRQGADFDVSLSQARSTQRFVILSQLITNELPEPQHFCRLSRSLIAAVSDPRDCSGDAPLPPEDFRIQTPGLSVLLPEWILAAIQHISDRGNLSARKEPSQSMCQFIISLR